MTTWDLPLLHLLRRWELNLTGPTFKVNTPFPALRSVGEVSYLVSSQEGQSGTESFSTKAAQGLL